MKTFTLLALFAAGALAAPQPAEAATAKCNRDCDRDGGGGGGGGGSQPLCPAGLLYSNPNCCDVDVLGIIDLGCQTLHENAKNGKEFQAACAKIGKKPLCCAIPISLLCQKPVGTGA